MGVVRKKEFAGKEIEIKEASVAEIRNWMKDLGSERHGDIIDMLLFDDFFIPDLYWFTNLTPGDIGEFTPSELEEIIAEVKELNPGFFGLQAKLLKNLEVSLATSASVS